MPLDANLKELDARRLEIQVGLDLIVNRIASGDFVAPSKPVSTNASEEAKKGKNAAVDRSKSPTKGSKKASGSVAPQPTIDAQAPAPQLVFFAFINLFRSIFLFIFFPPLLFIFLASMAEITKGKRVAYCRKKRTNV